MRYPFILALIVASIFAGSTIGGASAHAASTTLGWQNEYDLGNFFEARGFIWGGRHRNVDLGSCMGLRRYGVRTIQWEDYFHVFNCDLETDRSEFWTARVQITSGQRVQILSAHKEF